jgi:hypothetical protein
MRRALALSTALVLTTTPGCTLGGMAVASSVTVLHNGYTDDQGDWGYGKPIAIGALVGLVADICLLLYMNKAWSKPMT